MTRCQEFIIMHKLYSRPTWIREPSAFPWKIIIITNGGQIIAIYFFYLFLDLDFFLDRGTGGPPDRRTAKIADHPCGVNLYMVNASTRLHGDLEMRHLVRVWVERRRRRLRVPIRVAVAATEQRSKRQRAASATKRLHYPCPRKCSHCMNSRSPLLHLAAARRLRSQTAYRPAHPTACIKDCSPHAAYFGTHPTIFPAHAKSASRRPRRLWGNPRRSVRCPAASANQGAPGARRYGCGHPMPPMQVYFSTV